MDLAPAVTFDRDNFAALLEERGLTTDQVNTRDGDPFSEMNLIRRAITQARTAVPFIYRNAVATLPETLTWITALVDDARAQQKRRDAITPVISRGRSLLLLGPTGVGKTHQAYGALRRLAVTGVSATWLTTSSADLYAALRPRAGVDSETEFRRYAHARLLLVDDLGAAKATEWTEEINFRLVNHRYENQLPTLLTSNVLPKQLADRLGDRVASRLIEMCDRAVITGTDRRRNAA
ncbi:ATP-binding protein [Streptomyces halstedii]|uniref:ATP-binding protein n=1 Tax=Streptomyces halstedii TaxID=1944 RepID=A0ABS6TT16_STRHA|nr:ATP-binding protein [Streptomyces halstedii]MBV7671407.1 ATP-binding protein [Streptomyces halstedii]